MLSARPPRNAEGKRPDSFRHSLSVRPRLRSTEECKERGRGTWSFKSLNPSRRALQFSPPAFSAFLSKLGLRKDLERVLITRADRRRYLTGPFLDNETLNRLASGTKQRINNPAFPSISNALESPTT